MSDESNFKVGDKVKSIRRQFAEVFYMGKFWPVFEFIQGKIEAIDGIYLQINGLLYPKSIFTISK